MGKTLSKLVDKITFPLLQSTRRDNDFADRLSHRWTPLILCVTAIIHAMTVYFGSAIDCWVPKDFRRDQTEYTNSYCYIRNTYYLSLDDEVPAEEEPEKRKLIPYYQWVPVILLLQALLFIFPFIVWRRVSIKSGLDIENMGKIASKFTKMDITELRDKYVGYVTLQMNRYLRMRHVSTKTATTGRERLQLHARSCRCTRSQSNYLITGYMLTKLLYLANVVAQLFLLNVVLGTSFHSYGVDVLRGIVQLDEDWPTASTARFPRVTMCDLKVRRFGGNIHRYSIMCVLPINMFNEKIFLAVWFWLVFVGVVTAVFLVLWVVRIADSSGRRSFVRRHIRYIEQLNGQPSEPTRRLTDEVKRRRMVEFVHSYLGQDGVFVLRMIAHNTNTLTISEVISSLWDNYCTKMNKIEETNVDRKDAGLAGV